MKPGKDFIGVGVGVMVFNDQGQVFLARRGEKVGNESGTWEYPGGKVEYGDTLADTAQREMMEEFGIEVEVTDQLGAFDHLLTEEGQHWVAVTFIARWISGEPQILEPEKCDAIGWFGLEQLPQPLSMISASNTIAYQNWQQGKSRL